MMSSKYEFIRKPNGVVVAVSREELQAQDEELRARKMEAKPTPKGNADQARTASSAFAGRLRAILGLPEATTRQRQALAIAAETKAEPKEAAAILAALPDDKAAGFAHGGTLFPGSTVKHHADAVRILSILKSPEAEGREKQALELALGTSLPIDQVLALLRAVAKAQSSKIPTIAERAALEVEIGEDFEPAQPAKRGDAVWAKVLAKQNAEHAAQPAPPAPASYETISARTKA